MYGRKQGRIPGLGDEIWGGRNRMEDLALDGSIILKWIFKKWDVGTDWIDVTQNTDR
jgi:hypothetical protein